MRIPRKITIMGHEIKVVYDDKKCGEEYAWGLTSYTGDKILLCRKYHGEKVSKKNKEVTFLHELIHWILFLSGFRSQKKLEEIMTSSIAESIHGILPYLQEKNNGSKKKRKNQKNKKILNGSTAEK